MLHSSTILGFYFSIKIESFLYMSNRDGHFTTMPANLIPRDYVCLLEICIAIDFGKSVDNT